MAVWLTPAGPVDGRVLERYIGLQGQERICLVDGQGRVHHYDLTEVSAEGAHAST